METDEAAREQGAAANAATAQVQERLDLPTLPIPAPADQVLRTVESAAHLYVP